MSESIVTYDWTELSSAVQSKVLVFYQQEFKQLVLSFCSKSISSIVECYEKFSKQCKGKHGGYIALKWLEYDLEHEIATSALMWGGWDNALNNPVLKAPEQSLLEKEFVSIFTNAQLNKEKIPVMSYFDTVAPISVPSFVVNEKDNGDDDGSFVRISSFPGASAYVLIDPLLSDEVNERDSARAKSAGAKKALEVQKEDELYDWLRIQGLDVERQVKTSEGHRLDMWMPGKMIVEIKRGSVSGNDVCQCIEYASEYSVPVVVIGDKLTGSASRGLHGFNKLCPDRKISFVSWDIAYDYLKGKFF